MKLNSYNLNVNPAKKSIKTLNGKKVRLSSKLFPIDIVICDEI